MAESSQNKTQKFIAKCEFYMDERYYIHPPRDFMFSNLLKLWGAILFLAFCSIGLLPFFFIPAFVMIFYWFKPLVKLWGVYYSKVVLIMMTIFVFIGSYIVAPFLRNALWELLQRIR